jgi:WD40 repeat protein
LYCVQIDTALIDITDADPKATADTAAVAAETAEGSAQPQAVWTGRLHTKFVVNVDWSPCGDFLLTCSQDKSVALHRPKKSPLELEVVTHLRFQDTPECAVFVPPESVPAEWLLDEAAATAAGTEEKSSGIAVVAASASASDTLSSRASAPPFMVIALRGLSTLLYVNCITLASHKVSLNEHDWDSHVSFTVLHLALSPCRRFLVAATDKDMHIVYQCGTNERMQVLAGGHSSDSYGRPKVAWDCTSSYLFCNSQGDNSLHVYSLCSGRVVGTLRHHTGQIRDIASHATRRALLTASYDHSVAEWLPA